MPALRELQAGFAQALVQGPRQDLAIPILAKGLSGERRFRIYRNNVFHSLSEALRACYPVVEKLVGKPFFDFTARQYIRDCPSVSGNLQQFGTGFADFLRGFAPASDLVYLPDVARLEWAMQAVYHAAEARPLNLNLLAHFPAEDHCKLVFQLHPASRLVTSRFPILQIWQANQSASLGDQRIDLNAGICRLLVIRRERAIEMEALSASNYALLAALRDDSTSEFAYIKAKTAQSDFDLGASLQDFVSRQVLVGFSMPSSHD
jgi:hypothetical protein